MLEALANFAEIIGGIAVIASLLYVGFQLNETRIQVQANAYQQRMSMRSDTWSDQLDKEALFSANEKMFEEELYRRDVRLDELEELTYRERRALNGRLAIELIYFNTLHYLRSEGLVSQENAKPLDYMVILNSTPVRRQWKDVLRLGDHFPADFVSHVDKVVKKYDEVERRMDADENADYSGVVDKVFDRPPPPQWID
jgi:hypothetical protein